ncbi:MAG: hypothetical protein R2792_18895 [Saprospiraceae bacterium]|jgi:hypothetical protein
MTDNLRGLYEDWESKLPEELEDQLFQQVNNISVFGKVIELFVPNALQTAAQLIGGGGGPSQQGGGRGTETDPMDWRVKPR